MDDVISRQQDIICESSAYVETLRCAEKTALKQRKLSKRVNFMDIFK